MSNFHATFAALVVVATIHATAAAQEPFVANPVANPVARPTPRPLGRAPALDVADAAADILTVPPPERQHVRYISLSAEPDRDAAVRVLNYWLNALSSAPVIELSPVVGHLLRVRLDHYRIAPSAWDALLADPKFSEPYFHLRTTVLDPRTKKPLEVLTDGGWTGLPNAEILRTQTGTPHALVRCDWFLWHATREENYYRMAGIGKTLGEFFEQSGVDREKIQEVNAFIGANILRSGVTGRERRVARYPSPFGVLWISFDPATNRAAESPFRNLGGFTFAANEVIASTANGLHKFFICDASGKRQTTVPDFIAKDSRGDGVLRPAISCMTCHAAESGWLSVKNDQLDIPIVTADKHEAQSRGRFYLNPRFDDWLARDREDYEFAVGQATRGWTIKQTAEATWAIIARHHYTLVDLTQAAVELGVSEAACRQACIDSRDPVLYAISAGKGVHRESFDASFGTLATLCYNAGLRGE